MDRRPVGTSRRPPELAAGLLSENRDQVLCQLREIYSRVALRNFRAVAGRFDNAADKFTRCACIIPPDTKPDQVINDKPKVVEAWRQAETHAAELDQLLEPLCCSAELVRGLDQPSGIGGNREYFLLPLTVDATDLHRRVVWHAWTGLPLPKLGGLTRESMQAPPPKPVHNRCGKWARMLAIGGIIRAADPSSVELFNPLQPVGVKLVQTAANKAGYVRFDPEGDRDAPRRRGPGSLLLDRLSPFRRRNTDGDETTVDLLDTVADVGDDTPEPDLRAEGWGIK